MAGDITRTATIKFEADTSAAQARIQQLAQSLQSAINFGVESSGVAVIDKQLQAATSDAIKLQAQLSQAVNVNTGKLDLTKFTQSLKTGQTSLQQYQQSLSQLGPSGQAAFAALARSIATAEAPMQRVSNVLAQMGTTLKNTIKWNISASIINGFVGSIQQAFSYAEKLNDSLNRIQIVTGESTAQMAKFAQEANKSAQLLSTTTRQYTDAALIFYQQGLNDSQVKARTDAVIKMANVTGDASKEVSNYMTAIWNNFANGTASLESFEDKIVSLGATTASSSAEIAAGLEKFAAVGNTIGLSFDYAAAALATVVAETRQSADTVGTAFRTLFSRLQGLKLGETLEDGTSLNKYSAALATVGVQIQDASGQLKNMDTILNDLAGNWDNLTQAQKVALAQTVGGARQYTTLISLMENWDQFQKNLATEAGSEGALQKQADTYAQSWEAAKNRVTASMESIYSSLINDKFMINLNNGLAKALQGVNALIKGMGGMSGLMSRIGAVALTVFEKQIAASLRNLSTNLELMTQKGQEKMRQIQIETTNMMGKLSGTGAGSSVTANAYSQEAQAQNLIIQNMDKMDSIEQARAQTIQKIIQARSDENAKLGQTITDLTDLQSKQMHGAETTTAELNKFNTELSKMTMDNGSTTGLQIFDKIKQEMAEIQTIFEDKGVITQFLESFNSADTATARLAALKAKMAELAQDGGPRAVAVMNTVNSVMNQLSKGSIDTEKAIEKINRILSTGMESASNSASRHLTSFNTNIDELIKKSNELGNTTLSSYLTTLKVQFNGAATTTEQLADALVKASNNTLTTNQAMGLLKILMGEVSVKTLDTSQKIVKFGQVLTTISSAINQIAGMIDIWKDKDASFGKKLLTTITTIGMLLPLLIRLKTNIAEIGLSNLKAAAETNVHSAALLGEATAATGAAGATKAFWIELNAALGPIGWIIAAITLLTAAFVALYNATDHRTNFEKLEDLKTEADTIKTKVEETKTAIQEMYDTFSEYEAATEALSKLTDGTEAWRSKLAEIKGLQQTIIEQMPIVAEILNNPAAFNYTGKIYDDNGQFTEQFVDFYTGVARDRLTASALATYAAENYNSQEQIEVAKAGLSENYDTIFSLLPGFNQNKSDTTDTLTWGQEHREWSDVLGQIVDERAAKGAASGRSSAKDLINVGTLVEAGKRSNYSEEEIQQMAYNWLWGDDAGTIVNQITGGGAVGTFFRNNVIDTGHQNEWMNSLLDYYIAQADGDILAGYSAFEQDAASGKLSLYFADTHGRGGANLFSPSVHNTGEGGRDFFNLDSGIFTTLTSGKEAKDGWYTIEGTDKMPAMRVRQTGEYYEGEFLDENVWEDQARLMATNRYLADLRGDQGTQLYYSDLGGDKSNGLLQIVQSRLDQNSTFNNTIDKEEARLMNPATLGAFAMQGIQGSNYETGGLPNQEKLLGTLLSPIINNSNGDQRFGVGSDQDVSGYLTSQASLDTLFPGVGVKYNAKARGAEKWQIPIGTDEENNTTYRSVDEATMRDLARSQQMFEYINDEADQLATDFTPLLEKMGYAEGPFREALNIGLTKGTGLNNLTYEQAQEILHADQFVNREDAAAIRSAFGFNMADVRAITGADWLNGEQREAILGSHTLGALQTINDYADSPIAQAVKDLLLAGVELSDQEITDTIAEYNSEDMAAVSARTAEWRTRADVINNEAAIAALNNLEQNQQAGQLKADRYASFMDEVGNRENASAMGNGSIKQTAVDNLFNMLNGDIADYMHVTGISGTKDNKEVTYGWNDDSAKIRFVDEQLIPALDVLQEQTRAIQSLAEIPDDIDEDGWKEYKDQNKALLTAIFGEGTNLEDISVDQVRNAIATYTPEALDEVAAAWIPLLGTETVKYLSGDAAHTRASEMIAAQAGLDGYDLKALATYGYTYDSSLDAEANIANYENAVRLFNNQNGFDTFVTNYTNGLTSEVHTFLLDKDRTDSELTTQTEQKLTKLRQSLAKLLGINEENLDQLGEEFIERNWQWLEKLSSGSAEEVDEALDHLFADSDVRKILLKQSGLHGRNGQEAVSEQIAERKAMLRTPLLYQLNNGKTSSTDRFGAGVSSIGSMSGNLTNSESELNRALQLENGMFENSTVNSLRQAIADVLGIAVDSLGDDTWEELFREWQTNGVLTQLGTKGQGAEALTQIISSMETRGIAVSPKYGAEDFGRILDVGLPDETNLTRYERMAKGITTLEGLMSGMVDKTGAVNEAFEHLTDSTIALDDTDKNYIKQMREGIADLLGLDASKISDEMLTDWYENGFINQLFSSDSTTRITAANSMLEGYNISARENGFTEVEAADQDILQSTLDAYLTPEMAEAAADATVAKVVSALAQGDTKNLTALELSTASGRLSSSITDNAEATTADEAGLEKNWKDALISRGYLNEDGTLSDAAKAAGIETIQIAQQSVIDGMNEAADLLNSEDFYPAGLDSALKTQFQEVWKNVGMNQRSMTNANIIGSSLQTASDKGGLIGANAMASILSQAGNDAARVASALSSIDLSTASFEDIQHALILAGVYTSDWDDEINRLIGSMAEAVAYTDELASALSNYSKDTNIADKIRNGQELTDEEYERWIEQMEDELGSREAAEQAAQDTFRRTANQGWLLEDTTQNEAEAGRYENATLHGFDQSVAQAQGMVSSIGSINASGLSEADSRQRAYNDRGTAGFTDSMGLLSQTSAYTGLDTTGQKKAQDFLATMENSEATFEEFDTALQGLLELLNLDSLQDLMNLIAPAADRHLEEAQEAQEDAPYRTESDNLTSTVKNEIGMSAEDLENYTEVLAETRGGVKDFTKLTKEQQLEWKKLAALQAMAENGLTNFNKTALDNIDTMKNSKKGTKEYSDSLGELTKDVKHIFGNSKAVTEKFVEDNLGLIEDMANGVEGSAEEVEENILRAESAMSDWNYDAKLEIDVDGDGAIDEITTVGEYLNNFGDEYADMPIGFEIESDPAIDALNQMLQAGQMTATGITDALNDVGWMPEISYEEMTLGEAQEAGVKGSVQVVLPTGEVQEGTIEGLENVGADTMIRVPTINSAKKTGGGASGSLPSGRRGRGGGGRRGGGGGDRRKETGDRKKKENRYVTNTNQLEDIQDKLDKLNKAEERSYGRNRLKQMQDKTKILKDLAAKQKDLYDEAVAYQKADREALENNEWAKKMGIKFEFDENGTILDRDKIEQQMVDFYNSYTEGKDDEGNWILKDQSDSGKKKFKEMQEAWEELNEQLDKYDESQDKVKEYHQAILDSINEEYDNLVEMANYKVEIQVDVSDEALKILDFMLAKIEDDAYKAADAIAIMGQQAWEAQAQNRINDNGIRDILKVHNGETQYADADGNLHTTTNINKDIGIDKLMNGDAEAWSKLMSLEKEFTQDEVDALQGFMDAKIEQAQNLMELQKDVYAKVSEVFDKGTEDMDRLINKMDHLRTITSSYLNIVDLVGKKHLGITNDFLDEMQLSGVDQDINKVSASLTKLNTQRKMLSNFRNQFGGNTQTLRAAATADEKAEREAMAQRMERMGASAEAVAQVRASIASDQVMQLTQRDKDLITEEINHMEDEIQASTEDFHSAWEDAITSIADFYTAQIGRAIEDASDKLAGELGSLDELADKFAKTQEVNDLYVEDFEKIYEMSKLNRDILKSIDETDNVKAKQRLVEYQAELNQLEEDRAQMSEYEIENARRRYELLLAELALEESKNAKSQVQMARNDLGEWSYVYTADESAVEEAEQNYEDKLYAMQRANADYINSLQENIVDLQQRMVEEIEAIRIEDYASAEEYWNAINDIKEHYSTLMDGNMEQMDIVFNEQTRLYEEDWATYSEMTGYKISADEDYIDKWNETAISKLTGFETMEEYHRNFNDTTDELLKQCNESYEIWEDKVKETMEAAGTTMDDFTEQMNTDVGEMTSQSGELASSMETTGATIVQAFDDMTEALSNWQAEYSKSIEEMLEKNEALAKSFNNLLKEWSGYNEATGLDDSSGEGEGTEGSTEEIEESTEEPAAEPMPEERRESPEEKTRRLKKGVAAAIWGYRGGAGWGHGNSSRKLTSGTRYRRFKEKGLIPDEVQQQINRYSGWSRGRMLDDAGLSYSDLKKYTYPHFAFDTGGYTGDWDGTDGRFALLHSKEIVLNKEDTANFLAGIEILRDITKAIDLNAMASAGYMAKIANAPTIGGLGTTLEQEVHITAEFPNATDRNEIEAAFGDIINLASQYANRQQ